MKHCIHLAASAEPITRTNVTTLCGAPVANPEFPFSIEGDLVGQPLESLGSCRKCKAAWLQLENEPGRLYVCGVRMRVSKGESE